MSEVLRPTESMWVTRDGTPIWIKDMHDQHLLNTVRMLRRNAKRKADAVNSPMWDGDDFADDFGVDEETILSEQPWFATMLLELRRRRLKELDPHGPPIDPSRKDSPQVEQQRFDFEAHDRVGPVYVLVFQCPEPSKHRDVGKPEKGDRKRRKKPVSGVRRKRAKVAR